MPDSGHSLCFVLYPKPLRGHVASSQLLAGGAVGRGWTYRVQETELLPDAPGPGIHRQVTETGVTQAPNKYVMINRGKCWPSSAQA